MEFINKKIEEKIDEYECAQKSALMAVFRTFFFLLLLYQLPHVDLNRKKKS